jgi:hypothetical protein
MTHTTKPISPLRQRMIDDMMMRKLAPQTHTVLLFNNSPATILWLKIEGEIS